MNDERQQHLERLLEHAQEVPTGERSEWMAEQAGDDSELRGELASLIAALDRERDFLEPPGDEPEGGDAEPAPDEIGSFRILRQLGAGGSSRVWLAARRDGDFERQVAVKIPYRSADPELLRRFLVERRILAALDHPHIARLFDSGTTEDGRPYFVMEYVAGTPIDLWCDRQRLNLRRRIELLRKVCTAVHYAHQRLVVHRDIKPSNVLVNETGEPKLVDFGIAKLLDPAAEGATTRHGLQPLTLAYASPEQIAGGDVATPTDVYSLGLLAYRLLCGRLPHDAKRRGSGEPTQPPSALVGPAETVAAARGTTPARLRHRLRGDLDRIALKATHAEPERRYASCAQLSEDLRRYLAGLPIAARGDSWAYRARRWVARNRLAAALAAGLFVALVIFSAVAAATAHRLAAERDRAERTTDLVVDLFELSSPERARGRTITAREVLAEGERRVQTEFAHMPEQQSVLLATLGAIHHQLGLYDDARRLLEQAVELERASASGDLSARLTQLGELADDQGDHERAVAALREALELRRGALGDHHPKVAESRTTLAAALVHGGEIAAGEPLLDAALAVQRRPGADRLARATTLNELALLHLDLGAAETAEPMLREALDIWRTDLGPDHPHVATALSNLGAVLALQDHHQEAAATYGEALVLRRRILGPDHPDVALTLHNLASSLITLGRLEEAEAALDQAVEVHRKVFGEASVEVAKSMTARARLAMARGDLPLAERRLVEALDVGRRAMRPGDPGIAHALLALGRLRMQMGNPRAALSPLREAAEVRRAGLPPGNPLIAEAEAAVAACEARLR